MAGDDASIGSVYVDVEPRAAAFFSKLQAQVMPGASRFGDQLGATIGKAIQDRIAKGMADGIQAGARSAQASSLKAGTESGGAFADAFKKRVEAALKALPKAKIDGDSSGAQRAVADLRAEIESLSNKKISAEFSGEQVRAEMDRLIAKADELGAKHPEIQARTDLARASAEMAAFGVEVDRLDGRQVDIQVDADTGGAQAGLAGVNASAILAQSGIASLIAVGIGIGPAIVPAAAAAAAAIGAIGPAAAVGLAGIGTMALAIVPVVGAVKAMGAAQDAAGKSAVSAAGKQSSLAAAIDGVRSAQASLANTRANAAAADERAEQRVTDAIRAEEQAQKSLLRAQQAISDARKAATRELEDMATREQDLALEQRRSALDIAKAQADLAKAKKTADQKPTGANKQALAEAQLAYDEQIQRSKELSVEQKRFVQDKAEADRKGVDGSKQVVAAQDAIAAAQEKVRASQQAVADARTQQVETARQGEFSVAQATQAVVNAQRSVQQASVSAGTTGSAAMTKLQQAMDKLTPAGAAFATFLYGLKGQFDGLSRTAQNGLLPGLQAFLQALLPVMPQVNTLVGIFAQTMGDIFRQAGPVVAEILPPFLNMLGQVGPPILKSFATILLNIGKGFGGIIEAFAPFAQQFFQGLADLSTKFADFGTSLATNQGFQAFIDYVVTNGPTLLDLFKNIAVIVGKLLVAFAPLGAVIVNALDGLTGFLASLSPNTLALITYAVSALVIAILAVVAIMSGGVALIPAIIVAVGVAFVALGALGIWLWHNVLVPAWNAISAAIDAAWQFIKPIFDAIGSFITGTLGPIFLWLWHNVISPVWTGIKVAIEVAWALIQVVFGLIEIYIKAVLAPVFVWLWHNVIEPVWNGIAAVVSSVWNDSLKPLFSALGDFMRDYVVPVFRGAVDAIGKAWDGLKALARAPVEFVVNKVVNPLINGYNGLAKTFGAPHVDPIPGFAYGGYISGPGGPRDDLIPAMLSNGEYVIPANVVARLGVGYFDQLTGNRSAGASSPYFADGGFVGFFKDVWNGLTDPIGLLKKPAEALLGKIPGGGFIRDILTGMGHKLVDGLIGFVKGHATAPGGKANDAAIGGPAGNAIQAIIRLAAMSGIPYSVTSTLRSGDKGYHGRGMAVDFGDFQYGAGANNRLAAYFMRAAPDLLELIHTGGPGFYVKNGRQVGPGYYGSATVAAHRDHVHVAATPGGAALAAALLGGDANAAHGYAGGGLVHTGTYDQGGYLMPGLTLAYNGTGQPETIRTAGQEAALGRGGGPSVTTNIYPRADHSESEIGRMASNAIAWELRTIG